MKRVEERFGLSSFRYKRAELFARVKADEDVLLLDLREKSEYDEFHIQGALNYPACMMSRSMYQFTPEILHFKNKEGKLMVLYDVGEKLSAAVGTNWYEKGIENFVVLSGGLAALARSHPHLTAGDAPTAVLAARPQTASPAKPLRAGRAAYGREARPQSAGMVSAARAPVSVPRPARWTALRQSGASFYSQASFALDS
jgi:rhodanese-related sulfurtransferase